MAVVSGKSGSTTQLASIAEDLIKQDSLVISIQNGLGNSGIIASRVGWGRVLGELPLTPLGEMGMVLSTGQERVNFSRFN